MPLAVLRELGIQPRVKVVEIPNRRRFATSREPSSTTARPCCCPTPRDVREELERLLGAWLLGRRGALRSPLRTVPAAILEWTPAVRRRTPSVSEPV